VGWRKKLRKRIAALERVIVEHQQKLAEERAKVHPDQRLIDYWEKEIRARQETLKRLKKRLTG
jgi:peptidoglycan hydrolase CwlO-like protein